MAEDRTLPGFPRKKLVREVRKYLTHLGIRPAIHTVWVATWAWARQIANSYHRVSWPLPAEIAAQYVTLLVAEIRRREIYRLPYRAAEQQPDVVKALLAATGRALPEPKTGTTPAKVLPAHEPNLLEGI